MQICFFLLHNELFFTERETMLMIYFFITVKHKKKKAMVNHQKIKGRIEESRQKYEENKSLMIRKEDLISMKKYAKSLLNMNQNNV